MPKKPGVFDSSRYRNPTKGEVAEIIRLRYLMAKADRDDNKEAKIRAVEAMRRLLETMELKK
jgi:hypothetical protein